MLYIRTDMNQEIATGHMMRCLSIADAAVSLGGEASFILADSQALDLIRERGHDAVVLGTEWNDMEGELNVLYEVIRERKIRLLLIDSYMVTEHYLHTLSQWVNTAYIDDRNSFHYPVHTLICYANYWQKFNYVLNYRETCLLLGSQFVPLRKEFKGLKRKEVKKHLENILLMSGGSDNYHILPGLLKKIDVKKYKNIDVICGRYCADYEQLCSSYSQDNNIHFHKSVDNIEDYMIYADLAVSAGGTTLYELCACGTPSVIYSFADNQLDNVIQFDKDGLMEYLGDARYEDIFSKLPSVLDRCDKEYGLRKKQSEEMQHLIDGYGADRIAEKLQENEVNIKMTKI